MRILTLLIAAASIAPATHAAEATDSMAAALATYWGSAVNTASLTPAEREAFVKGFEENFSNPTPERTQYLRGASFATQIATSLQSAAQMGLSVDNRQLASLMAAALRGEPTGFTPAQAQDYIDRIVAPDEAREFSPESQADFIATAAAADGAVTTPSGLVFQVITEGEGPAPQTGDKVNVSYTGRLSDGSTFDTTDSPVTFTVGSLVPGMNEGLTLMKPGGTYRLVIPSSLAYGPDGIRGVIPGGAALDFTVTYIGPQTQ